MAEAAAETGQAEAAAEGVKDSVSFRDGPKDQTRNLDSMLRIAPE
jgi:hypothetical protein